MSAGLLTPGPDALSVLYKGSTHSAALLADGTIRYDGKAYGSASAFSIHVKRLITPDKQGDDGWKSVLYQGKPLDVYRCKGGGLHGKGGGRGVSEEVPGVPPQHSAVPRPGAMCPQRPLPCHALPSPGVSCATP